MSNPMRKLRRTHYDIAYPTNSQTIFNMPTVTVVSREDRRKSDDRGMVNKEYGVHGRNQVLFEGIRFCWKESGFVSCVVNMA
jgi:hypothetical protein